MSRDAGGRIVHPVMPIGPRNLAEHSFAYLSEVFHDGSGSHCSSHASSDGGRDGHTISMRGGTAAYITLA